MAVLPQPRGGVTATLVAPSSAWLRSACYLAARRAARRLPARNPKKVTICSWWCRISVRTNRRGQSALVEREACAVWRSSSAWHRARAKSQHAAASIRAQESGLIGNRRRCGIVAPSQTPKGSVRSNKEMSSNIGHLRIQVGGYRFSAARANLPVASWEPIGHIFRGPVTAGDSVRWAACHRIAFI